MSHNKAHKTETVRSSLPVRPLNHTRERHPGMSDDRDITITVLGANLFMEHRQGSYTFVFMSAFLDMVLIDS